MKKAKCLVCKSEIPWWQKLLSNPRVGMECRSCHSIMRHPKKVEGSAFVLVIVATVLLAKYKFDLDSVLYLVGWLIIVSLAIGLIATSKLELVYENKLRERDA